MSLQGHVEELQRRHQALEKEIHSAQTRPATSDHELAELKRKKLQLKDEIEKLRIHPPKS
jgi:hypothetical protein